jgi:hypothetical protein
MRFPRLSMRGRAAALALATTAATAVIGVSTMAFAGQLFSDDFEDGDQAGWSKSGGNWVVVTDGSRALSQNKLDSELARVFGGMSSWTDYTVQARVKPLAFDGVDRYVGLAARSTGSTTFDRLVLLNNGTAQLQTVSGSTVAVRASLTLPVSTGTWYTLRIDATGSTIRGYVNGTLVGSGASQAATGRIGLQTFHATASFDDVLVSTAGTTPSPSVSASASAGPSPSASVSVSASPSPSASPSAPASPSTSPLPSGALIVATTGNDANPGTLAQPLRTIQAAVNLVQPGGSISIRGGTYAPATNIQIMKSGTSSAPISLSGYQGERVVLDGENMPNTPAPLGGSIPRGERGAIHMEASWWRITGLEIVNGPYGVYCAGCNNNVFTRLVTHDNYESGFQLQGVSSNNQIINLDSYLNRDPRKNGESADGLAIKEGSGSGNLVRGARLWSNVDDGFDAWLFTTPITVENSVAWGNGFNRWNFPDFAGDGNGFKMGGGDPDPPANHTIRNSIAFDNAQGGFIDNGNPGALQADRNTAYRNGGTGFDFADSQSTLTRDLSVRNAVAVSLGSGSTGSGNSWNIGGTWSDASLLSTDPSVITGPRNADGSIRTSNFLRPVSGADLGARI